MTEYALIITEDGTTDWITTSRSKVKVLHIDFDELAAKPDLMLCDIRALAREVNSLPPSMPQREQIKQRLEQLMRERERKAGAFC